MIKEIDEWAMREGIMCRECFTRLGIAHCLCPRAGLGPVVWPKKEVR